MVKKSKNTDIARHIQLILMLLEHDPNILIQNITSLLPLVHPSLGLRNTRVSETKEEATL